MSRSSSTRLFDAFEADQGNDAPATTLFTLLDSLLMRVERRRDCSIPNVRGSDVQPRGAGESERVSLSVYDEMVGMIVVYLLVGKLTSRSAEACESKRRWMSGRIGLVNLAWDLASSEATRGCEPGKRRREALRFAPMLRRRWRP